MIEVKRGDGGKFRLFFAWEHSRDCPR